LDEWLKADMLSAREDTVLVFSDEGQFGEFTTESGETKETFDIGVSSPKWRGRWTMNKTSQRAVASLYGPDTKEWVRKKVSVFLADTNIGGKMRKVIYARGRDDA